MSKLTYVNIKDKDPLNLENEYLKEEISKHFPDYNLELTQDQDLNYLHIKDLEDLSKSFNLINTIIMEQTANLRETIYRSLENLPIEDLLIRMKNYLHDNKKIKALYVFQYILKKKLVSVKESKEIYFNLFRA